MVHSFKGWQMKDICHTHLKKQKKQYQLLKLALGKGLKGVEVGGNSKCSVKATLRKTVP